MISPALIIWIPVVVAFICAIFTLMGWHNTTSEYTRKTMSSAMWFYVIVAGVFLAWICYRWYPVAFVAAYPLCYFCMAFMAVAFYRLTCVISGTRFSPIHYLTPILLSLFMLVWSSLVPFEVKVEIIEGYAKPDSDYPIFSRFFTSILATMLVFSLIYAPLCIKNYYLYRKNEEVLAAPYMLRWLRIVLILVGSTIIIPIVMLLFGRKEGGIPILNLSAISVSVFCIIMIENVLKGNYPRHTLNRIVVPKEKEEPKSPITTQILPSKPKPEQAVKANKDEQSDFKQKIEQYFRKEKPYLNPSLKLEELAKALGYSRNRLSALINLTFQMNYNAYINNWRLKEMEILNRKLRSHNISQTEIAYRAGFGSYHSYLRAKTKQ
ncbi:AraC-like DNA-binding protein [Dysgonomonadaceae bacterium PH5-43]|nr:AraC-like DNA-binding protein [Dysgonomonadaceae bacterium PH5-43]